ncbi:MAG TPA: hypothetical protein V6D14_30785 [Coleofasciculaceae cyanobacterium]|jgi:hypothetical protein
MNTKCYLVRIVSKKTFGSLISIGAMILGMTTPALSQTYNGTPQFTIIPVPPTPGQLQPVAVPSQPTSGQPGIIPSSVNLNQLVTQWGLTPIPCTAGVVTIRLDTNTVCVRPTPQLLAGDYIYNVASNQLNPVKVGAPFTFKSVSEYGNCLEDLLRLYEDKERFGQQGRLSNCSAEVFQAYSNNGLPKEQALQLIKTADFYATSLLNPKLYPPLGLRRRIAQSFGFIYEIDTNDQGIRKLVTQEAVIERTDSNSPSKLEISH